MLGEPTLIMYHDARKHAQKRPQLMRYLLFLPSGVWPVYVFDGDCNDTWARTQRCIRRAANSSVQRSPSTLKQDSQVDIPPLFPLKSSERTYAHKICDVCPHFYSVCFSGATAVFRCAAHLIVYSEQPELIVGHLITTL